MRRAWGAGLVVVMCGACGSGDNTIARSFHASVKPGMALLQSIVDAEKAQKPEVHFAVLGQDCGGAHIEMGRSPWMLHIRVTHAPPSAAPAADPGYDEVGYGSREDFVRGLTAKLPSFYACKTFLFRFGRDQVWPTADTFTVTIDTKGEIVSVSELREEPTSL